MRLRDGQELAQCVTGNGRDQDSKLPVGLHTPESTLLSRPGLAHLLRLKCPSAQAEAFCSGPSLFSVSTGGLSPSSAPVSLVIAHILVLFCILFRAFLMALHPERHQRILRPPLCLEMQIKWLLLRGKGGKLMFYCFKLGSGYSVMYCVALNAFLCLIFH